MRLINADELINKEFEKFGCDPAYYQGLDAAQSQYFIEALNCAPTIDAVPVKRGEWEVAIGYDPNKKVQCQNCYKMAYEPTPYCPNCGALCGGYEK